jgi:hypothetical protein
MSGCYSSDKERHSVYMGDKVHHLQGLVMHFGVIPPLLWSRVV